ncbi:major facilitator superfamily domain-containing protein [Amylostereum chailletii]|nr:major facilitator superfamily domain-containing protein [Amylostereum chailletii]
MLAFLLRPLSAFLTPPCPTSHSPTAFPRQEKCRSSSPRPDTLNSDASLESLPASPVSTVCHAPIPIGHPSSGLSQRLSTPRVFSAHIGAALTLFLATTDSTIVSTSLPTIAKQFSASSAAYTWVGVSYMLTQTACQPLYGRISDLVGRKSVLFTSIVIFAIGSLLCGAAQASLHFYACRRPNITWLIVARGISGVGGGGIVSCVWVITSEIVEVRKRAMWSQALSVTWSCSAIAGPLLGGVFSGGSTGLSWRWAFYLNLPICAVSIVVLAFSLHGTALHRSRDASWDAFLRKFDFVGLFLFISGTSSIIVGFSFASASGWKAPSTLALIIVGIVILLGAGIYESETTREALFPPLAFKSVNIVIILIINFLHNFAFNSGTFYLARYYQAGDRSTLQASLMLLPYSLGSSLASMPAAWVIGYFQRRSQNTSGQGCVITLGLLISTIGFGG